MQCTAAIKITTLTTRLLQHERRKHQHRSPGPRKLHHKRSDVPAGPSPRLGKNVFFKTSLNPHFLSMIFQLLTFAAGDV